MDATLELSEAASGKYRAIFVSEKDVDLRPSGSENRLFVMKIAEGSLAAGGRGGGFGERRLVSVSEFEMKAGNWSRTYHTEEEAELSRFEIPYHVARIPVVLSDGSEVMGYGVVDPSLVVDFVRRRN